MIHAVLPVRSELEAGVADALEASLGVHTAAVSTHHSVHNTLINIHAGLFRGGSLVTLMALALVSSRCVDTVSVDTRITHTLIHIDTLPADVLSVSHVALAAVALQGGDAASVQTQVGEMFAHVDGFIHRNRAYMLVSVGPVSSKASSVAPDASVTVTVRNSRILVAIVVVAIAVSVAVGEVSVGVAGREAVSLGNSNDTQTPELVRPPDRAHLGDLSQSPAASRVAAALHLRVLTVQLGGTAPVSQSRETGANTLIHTSGAICAGDVASWTGADVATSRVAALSSITHTGDGGAFIDVFTLVAGFTLTVACGTFTLVGSHGVDASSSGTKIWHSLALVHILARSAADVGDEAPPAGVWLGGALLAGVAPGSTNGGAAEGFGADDPAELALAHLVVHLGETWPRPVVSLALRASETVDTGASVGPDAAAAVLTAVLTHRLSTVVSCVSLCAGARVLCTAASIHTPDVTGLNSSSCSTAGRELAARAGTHVGSGAETITTGIPANGDDTLVSSWKSLPAGAAVRVEARATNIGPSQSLLAAASDPLHLSLVLGAGEAARLVLSCPGSFTPTQVERPDTHGRPSQQHLGQLP